MPKGFLKGFHKGYIGVMGCRYKGPWYPNSKQYILWPVSSPDVDTLGSQSIERMLCCLGTWTLGASIKYGLSGATI